MMQGIEELWGKLGSGVVTLLVLWATFDKYFPSELRHFFKRYVKKFKGVVNPYIQITFPEFSGNGFHRSKAYPVIERYLSANSSAEAKCLKAEDTIDGSSQTTLVFSMDYHEEITDDTFAKNAGADAGFKVWWTSCRDEPNRQNMPVSFFGGTRGADDGGRRYFTLKFHQRYRDVVTGAYLKHVLQEGKEIAVKDRQRKLYTNCTNSGGGYNRSTWIHVPFEHPANFETLAMDPEKKKEIVDDLLKFKQSKDYYAKIGKSWKRGYLLYGPPGTGKSSMVASMANLLEYDIYDLELTAVMDNTTLRNLLIDTVGKSIIVIEDIDCSLDLTGQRKGSNLEKNLRKNEEEMNPKTTSQVSLSGLLNFIDGLWSAIGGERLIVFTTNFKEKLDPALIRSGRMDKHVELSYCRFEGFKVLAKNYLDIEGHSLFPRIEQLLTERDMTPADVAETLMPKSPQDDAA
ncbi:unnamed protein product, partial [Cuscuta epithymum]